MESLIPKGVRYLTGALYSNYDQELDAKVEEVLRFNPLAMVASHCAWNFIGYIWFDGQKWHSEVLQYHQTVNHFEGSSAMDVINEANSTYGGK